MIDKKVRLTQSIKPKGLGYLAAINSRTDLNLSKAQISGLKQNGTLIFRRPTEVLLFADGRVGNILQWSEALGLKYATLAGRLRAGHCVDRILSPFHASKRGHHLLSDKQRALCGCNACYLYFRRKKEGSSFTAEKAKSNQTALQSNHPVGVAEPHLWKRIDSKTYAFKIGRVFKTIEQWSAILDIPESTLRARLTVYGKPIKQAILKDKELVHGVRNTYLYHKCRCDDCRRANTIYHRKLERRKQS